MNDTTTTVATVSPLFAALELALYSLIDARVALAVEPLVARIAELEKAQAPFDFESEAFRNAVTEIAEETAQSLMDDHTSEYDHDDIQDDSAIRDVVNDILNDATIEIGNVTIRV
jgi:hypothetical protein